MSRFGATIYKTMAEVSEMMTALLGAINGLNETASKSNEKLELLAEKLELNGQRIDGLARAVAGGMVQKVPIRGSKTGKKSSGEETADGGDNGDDPSVLETEGDYSGTGQNYQVALHEKFVLENTDAVKQALKVEKWFSVTRIKA